MMRQVVSLLLLGLVGACAYYNSLYNANRAYTEAEDARLEGRESMARSKYNEAIDKAAKSYRRSEEGRWADDALYLIGRSHARSVDWPEAQAALEAAVALTTDEELAAGARVFLGAAAVSLGAEESGMALLDSALASLEDDETKGEAFLWRARARYAVGDLDAAWPDLDSASVGGGQYRDEAGLDRLSWAVETGTMDQAAIGASALLSSDRTAAAKDTIEALLQASRQLWGPDSTLPLLERVDQAPWPPATRESLVLIRAEVAADAGDSVTALADARDVSAGLGPQADRARVLLARWRLAGMRDPGELDGIRALLLPAVGSPVAVGMLEAVKTVGLLVERSQREGQALALFSAGELARDTLASPGLARVFFLAYADLERGSAWEGKALLAALNLTAEGPERDLILARIAEIPDNIYVVAAHWGLGEDRQPEYTVLERRLSGTLVTIQAQVAAEARTRDVLVSEAARALDSLRTSDAIARRLAEGDSVLLDSLRLDSLRIDSIRLDSIRRDSLGIDTLFADPPPGDTFVPGPPTGPNPRPVVHRLRDPNGAP